MLYEKHIPELKTGQTILIKRPVQNGATKQFILSMFKQRAYYRLNAFAKAKIKTGNNYWIASIKGKLNLKIWVEGNKICYQEECLAGFL